jgi:hypothetical protein
MIYSGVNFFPFITLLKRLSIIRLTNRNYQNADTGIAQPLSLYNLKQVQ